MSLISVTLRADNFPPILSYDEFRAIRHQMSMTTRVISPSGPMENGQGKKKRRKAKAKYVELDTLAIPSPDNSIPTAPYAPQVENISDAEGEPVLDFQDLLKIELDPLPIASTSEGKRQTKSKGKNLSMWTPPPQYNDIYYE